MVFASSARHSDPMGFVVFAGILLLVAVIVLVRRSRRIKALRAAAAEVGAEVLEVSGHHLKARARGFEVAVQLSDGGKNSPSHTYVDVRTPPFDLLLALSLERTRGSRRGGDYLDVEVGDPGFDGAWVVEGAPVDRVQRLFTDASLRQKLVSFSAHRNPAADIEDGVVHLSKEGIDFGGAMPSTDTLLLALDLATAVMAENALPSPHATEQEGGYRAAPAASDDRSGDRAAVIRLKKERAVRALRTMRPLLFLLPIAISFPTMAFFSFSHARLPPFAPFLPAVMLVAPLWLMRAMISSYLSKRRMAELGADVPLYVTYGLCVAASVLWGLEALVRS
jgi:hypothetical protein